MRCLVINICVTTQLVQYGSRRAQNNPILSREQLARTLLRSAAATNARDRGANATGNEGSASTPSAVLWVFGQSQLQTKRGSTRRNSRLVTKPKIHVPEITDLERKAKQQTSVWVQKPEHLTGTEKHSRHRTAVTFVTSELCSSVVTFLDEKWGGFSRLSKATSFSS